MPTLQENLADLDNLKNEFIALRDRINKLEHDVATEMCPLKVGDTISISEGGKDYSGVVDEVRALYAPYDFTNPTIGNTPTWQVRGPRINKGTNAPGKWSFEFSGNHASLQNGVWVIRHKTFNDLLGS